MALLAAIEEIGYARDVAGPHRHRRRIEVDGAGVAAEDPHRAAHSEGLRLEEVILGLGWGSARQGGEEEDSRKRDAETHGAILAGLLGSVEVVFKRDSFPPIPEPGKKRQMLALTETAALTGTGTLELRWTPFVCGNT
jgi:hypothetical protein